MGSDESAWRNGWKDWVDRVCGSLNFGRRLLVLTNATSWKASIATYTTSGVSIILGGLTSHFQLAGEKSYTDADNVGASDRSLRAAMGEGILGTCYN